MPRDDEELDSGLEPSETCVGRVLVVEDEPELRRLVRRSLVRVGHEVAEALNGRAALELVRQQQFDVVVSDVRMPDVGGMELVERLHAEQPDLPVVLVSGAPDLVTSKRARQCGVIEFLMKPVSSSALRRVVSRAVALHRQRLQDHEDASVRQSGERLRAAPEVRQSRRPGPRKVAG